MKHNPTESKKKKAEQKEQNFAWFIREKLVIAPLKCG